MGRFGDILNIYCFFYIDNKGIWLEELCFIIYFVGV